MPEFDETMTAGFARARGTAKDGGKEASGATRVRKPRIRKKDGPEPRNPETRSLLEKNSLKEVVNGLVRLHEEKAEVQDSIKAEFAAARDAGYDVRALKVVIRRAMETDEEKAVREVTELTAEEMLRLLGMLAGTPLGDAAMRGHAE